MYTHVCVFLLHAYMHGSRKFRQGVGSRPNIFQGNPTLSGGVQLLFSRETCGFSRVGGPDLLPPPSGYAHDLCIKPLKVTKIVAGSMFSKGIGVHSHLKILC